METIDANDDLRIEITDGEVEASVIIYPNEINDLRNALADADGIAAAMAAGEHDKPIIV